MKTSTPSDGVTPRYPDSRDILEKLRFLPEEGQIWLGEQRMLLMQLQTMATFRHEIIRTLGLKRAKSFFLRLGYHSGLKDAELARAVRGQEMSLEDGFLTGPQLHSLRGLVKVIPLALEIDPHQGHFYGEFEWQDSYEVAINEQLDSSLDEPVCWMQLGYACAYSSQFLGQEIQYREVECRGRGDERCRIVGRPAAEWEDHGAFAEHFREDPLIDELYELQSRIAYLEDDIARHKGDEHYRPIGKTPAFLGALDLIESELFGVEKGAYTGAVQSRAGRFERAHGGTLFLDELAELSPRAQASLLRVLQEKQIERVGGQHSYAIDVRIVAATHGDLMERVQDGRFRADLFYRLNAYPVVIPPLRDRRDDIRLLAEHFLERFECHYQVKTLGFTDQAMALLRAHAWPGNIRELQNIIERGVILTGDGNSIDEQALFGQHPGQKPGQTLSESGHIAQATETEPGDALVSLCDRVLETGVSLEALETALLEKAYRESGKNVSAAARRLGMSRAALDYRLKKGGLA